MVIRKKRVAKEFQQFISSAFVCKQLRLVSGSMQSAAAVWTWSFHQKTFIIWKCMFHFSFFCFLSSCFLSSTRNSIFFDFLLWYLLLRYSSSDVCTLCRSKITAKIKIHENEMDLMKFSSVCRAHNLFFVWFVIFSSLSSVCVLVVGVSLSRKQVLRN